MKEIDDSTLAYVAGIVDGEGCVSARRFRNEWSWNYGVELKVSMTSEKTIRFLHEVTGVGNVTYFTPKAPRHRVWHWRVSSKEAAELCGRLLPFSVLKGEQMLGVIELSRRTAKVPRPKIIPDYEHEIRKSIIDEVKLLKA